jgi:magnesium chelatase family protein
LSFKVERFRFWHDPDPWLSAVRLQGMTRGPVREALQRIQGAFSKLRMPDSPVEILINLAPAAIEKDGTWLDLPLAVMMLQVAGILPDLRNPKKNNWSFLARLEFTGKCEEFQERCRSRFC